ncbi:MAG: GlsB/YeaQ/YmgE family stress response membrane protein [Polyangiaceae bacterium]|nr:GlsB/YeaQ/YmgE family stress response membrane protein [Polyangiaceae bacterium]
MDIVSWLVFGLIAGVIAKIIMPGRDPGGWIITIGLGIGGSYLGGYLSRKLNIAPAAPGFNFVSLGTAVAGAVILLLAYRIVFRRR